MSVRLTEKPVVVDPPHAARTADPQPDRRKTAPKLPRKPSGRWPWFVVVAAVVGIGAGIALANVLAVGKNSSGEDGAAGDGETYRRASLGFVPGGGGGQGRRHGRFRGLSLRHRARRGRPAQRHAPVDRQSDRRREVVRGQQHQRHRRRGARRSRQHRAEERRAGADRSDRREEQAGRRPGDARGAEGPAGPRRRLEQVQSRGPAGGAAGQGVGRSGRSRICRRAEGPVSPRRSSRPRPTIRRRPSTNWPRSAIASRCSRSSRRTRRARRP